MGQQAETRRAQLTATKSIRGDIEAAQIGARVHMPFVVVAVTPTDPWIWAARVLPRLHRDRRAARPSGRGRSPRGAGFWSRLLTEITDVAQSTLPTGLTGL